MFKSLKNLFKRKRYFGLTRRQWRKKIKNTKREVITEDDPYTGNSILGDIVLYLDTLSGKEFSRWYSEEVVKSCLSNNG